MRAALSLTAAVLGLCACGGSGSGPGPAPVPVTVPLSSVSGQEGTIESAGLPPLGSVSLLVGDLGAGARPGPFRSFLTFDLAGGLPAGATVTSATLQVRQTGTAGLPYTTLGTVRVDHVFYGAGLPDGTDFGAAPLSVLATALSSDGTLAAKSLDVTAQVVADRAAARPTSQFRLYFAPLETNGDMTNNFATFEDSANTNGSGVLPILLVTYTP